MFRIGIGPALIILVVLGTTLFDLPVIVLAPISAVIMCVGAFIGSRELNTLRIGAVVAMVATAKPLVKYLSAADELPGWLKAVAGILTSDGFVIAVSAIAFLLAAIYGMFGPLRHLKSVEDLLKEHKGK
ncbi:hypothetical protein CFM90_26390 (plasmid) [Ralstonia solanacearum]|nr:hypothetical protein CFM90_26390 [Ralstonia solanacearum]